MLSREILITSKITTYNELLEAFKYIDEHDIITIITKDYSNVEKERLRDLFYIAKSNNMKRITCLLTILVLACSVWAGMHTYTDASILREGNFVNKLIKATQSIGYEGRIETDYSTDFILLMQDIRA